MSRDIISKPSGVLLNSGIAMIAISVLISFVVASVIKYPETVNCVGIIVKQNVPIEVYAKSSNVIDSIFAGDNDLVHQGSFLAVSENKVSYAEILKIQKVLEHIDKLVSDKEWILFTIDSTTSHIAFNDTWTGFMKAIALYKTDLSSKLFLSEVKQTTNEINKTLALNSSLQRQIAIYTKELALNKKERDRKQTLYKQGVISESENETQETNYLNQSRQLEVMKSSKISNEIGIEKLKAQLVQIIDTHKKKMADTRMEILNLSLSCRNQLAEWKNQNLYIAPVSGKFLWAQKFSSKQFLTAGSLFGTIVPFSRDAKIMAYAKIPSTSLIEVYKGVEVQLIPQSYPLLDYGYISGTVLQVSLLPVKEQTASKAETVNYLVSISIDTSLVSSNGQKLDYKPNMLADIKIFTKNKSLLTKIFEPLLKILKYTH